MSRLATGENNVIAVPRTSNIYTVLSAVGLLAVILAMVVVWNRADTLFGGLLSQNPNATPMSTR